LYTRLIVNIKEETEVTRRQGRRCRKVLDDLNPLNAELNPICHLLALLGGATIVVVSRLRVKDRRGYSHLKEEALHRTMWRNHFGGGYDPVIRQNIE
jgi:hypothetical protein